MNQNISASTSMNPARQRALAVGLLALAILAALALIAVPVYLLHRHYDQQIEDLEDRLATYREVASRREALSSQLGRLQALDGRRFYLKSKAPALAAGEIQELLKSLAEAHAGRVLSMQILPHKDEGGLRRVAVNVQLMGSITTVRDVLRLLESDEPLLFIDNLGIRAVRAGASTPGAPEDELMVQFDVIGYAIAG